MTRWTRGGIFLLSIMFIFMLFQTINVKAIESESHHNHIYSYDDFKSKSLIVKTDEVINFNDYGVIDSSYIDDEIVTLHFDSIDKAIDCYEQLKDKEYIEFVEPDMYIGISEDNIIEGREEENNTYNSWGIEYLAIDKYSKYIKEENKNNIITIAVIDSGIDYNHPIFKDKLLTTGYDFVNNDDDPYDDDFQGHGTHVAGIIADATRNISNIKIMPLKALNSIGRGTISSVGNSIKYAIDSGVDIINLSLGFITGVHSKLIEEMIVEAVEAGVTVVNAAGNYNANTINSCPSHIDQAIIVSSIDNNNNKAYTSNYGPNIDVAAPGVGIYSAAPGGSYVYKNGTSMAAPHISVIAAMLKLNNPDLKPVEIENFIKEYSIDIGEKGVDWFFGSGVPNMALALPKVSLENILIDKDEITLEIGEKYKLNLVYYPKDYINDSEVLWESLALPKVSLENILIDKDEITLEIGEKYKLNLVYYPKDYINDSEVLWESSNNEVATVDNGEVMAVKEGESIITATILDKTASCKVIVKNNEVNLYAEDETLKLDSSTEENLKDNRDINENITEKEKSVELLYLDNSYKSEKIEEVDIYNKNNINDEENYKNDLDIINEDNDEVVIAYEKDIEENIIEDEQSNTIASESIENAGKNDNNKFIFIGLFLVVIIFIANKFYKRLKR